MSDSQRNFDSLIDDQGPAALVLTRLLEPVEGKDAWIFPPTFAAAESDNDDDTAGATYQIDDLGGGRNMCLIDSVGSQANRIEPIFKREPYSNLVPQVIVKMKDGHEINLLDVGHRGADAAVRFSKSIGPKLHAAFSKLRDTGDCSELARIAPTSLVFGVWDSRATQVKSPRIVRSVIRAYDVVQARKSATYRAAYDYIENGIISSELDKGAGKQNNLSQEGFKYALATGHGGVRVEKEIRQEALINLVTLRSLSPDKSLRRYLLGLALVGLSYRDSAAFNLREGCLLKAIDLSEFDGRWRAEFVDGRPSVEWQISHSDALSYAQCARNEFQSERNARDEFDAETASNWLSMKKEDRKKIAKWKHPKEALAQAGTPKA